MFKVLDQAKQLIVSSGFRLAKDNPEMEKLHPILTSFHPLHSKENRSFAFSPADTRAGKFEQFVKAIEQAGFIIEYDRTDYKALQQVKVDELNQRAKRCPDCGRVMESDGGYLYCEFCEG